VIGAITPMIGAIAGGAGAGVWGAKTLDPPWFCAYEATLKEN
jgi:hypothetical protein